MHWISTYASMTFCIVVINRNSLLPSLISNFRFSTFGVPKFPGGRDSFFSEQLKRLITRFLTQAEPLIFKQIELNNKNSTKRRLTAPFGWVFGVQLGLRQTQALFKTKTIRRGKFPPAVLLFSSKLLLSCNIAGGNFPLLIVLALISTYR